jgi:hypothetical protein
MIPKSCGHSASCSCSTCLSQLHLPFLPQPERQVANTSLPNVGLTMATLQASSNQKWFVVAGGHRAHELSFCLITICMVPSSMHCYVLDRIRSLSEQESVLTGQTHTTADSWFTSLFARTLREVSFWQKMTTACNITSRKWIIYYKGEIWQYQLTKQRLWCWRGDNTRRVKLTVTMNGHITNRQIHLSTRDAV